MNDIQIVHDGESMNAIQWSKRLGIDYWKLKKKIKTVGYTSEAIVQAGRKLSACRGGDGRRIIRSTRGL